MLQICRAEDGEVFQTNASLRDIERSESLEVFLQGETGVDAQAVLAYLPNGQRLRNDNLRELAGVQGQTIYVFNKYHLDYDLDEVLRDLRIDAPLQPPIEDSVATPPLRLGQLANSCLRAAHSHHSFVTRAQSTLHNQHAALRIASSSLDLNVLTVTETFQSIAGAARRELDRQTALLAVVDADLRIIARVRIHKEFMSTAVRKAIEGGERLRSLGDYVSNVKMKQVAETCVRTHEDLKARLLHCEQIMTGLSHGTNVVRASATKDNLLQDADACLRRSKECFDRISDLVVALEDPKLNADGVLNELKLLDYSLRNEVRLMAATKNAYTEECVRALRHISTLNHDLVALPPAMTSLQTTIRSKNSFSHIQRLHGMLYAYGATVIEIVRRKEFARFFYQRAQSILEVMARLSASERKRRQVYKGEIHGQLPFETRGMDEVVPTIDFSPSGSGEAAYSLERGDVDALLALLNEMDQLATKEADHVGASVLRECRTALEKLVSKMDSLESGFDKIAERSLLSNSRLSSSRRRLTGIDEQAFNELAEQYEASQQALAHQEAQFQEERVAMQAEIDRLKSELEEAKVTSASETERADHLERDLTHTRSQLENELSARRLMEHRQAELSADVEGLRESLATALADATNQTKAAEVLRQALIQTQAEFEDVKQLEARNAAKVDKLLEDQADTLRNLAAARTRGEDLEAQIQAAQLESADVKRALEDAGREKDRLLRAQASEHDRIMRDHIAEADGDRAVLEHQFHELQAAREDAERRLKDVQSKYEVSCNDAAGLKEELQRIEHEMREARHAERVLRDDQKVGRASQFNYEQRLEASSRFIAQILDVSIAFRNSHLKALSCAQAMIVPPNSGTRQSTLNDSTFLSSPRHSIAGPPEEPSPIDPSDLPAALDALRAFDHDHFLESIIKVGSTIKKWQRQCKEYRERAKGKISFRSFGKGDLALFLPTRNSVSKPWAAFNVSSPHYFLKATGHLAEQLKTREWIVAKITSITERVANHNDPTSNPYSLSDGVKYYMLEVEAWNQQSQQNKRRVSSRKVPSPGEKTLATSSLPAQSPLTPAPPEAEVEDSFPIPIPNTSHVYPSRTRANTSPPVVPSSLSKLLAQAPQDAASEVVPTPNNEVASPATSPPPPASPAHTEPPNHVRTSNLSTPLRPSSSASRMSASSKFSLRGIPAMGDPASGGKSAPTTAISDHQSTSTPVTTRHSAVIERAPPSPDGSMSEGMSNFISHRRRTTSYHASPTSPLVSSSKSTNGTVPRSLRTSNTFANLAGVLGFSRNKIPELTNLPAAAAAAARTEPPLPEATDGDDERALGTSARDILKRF